MSQILHGADMSVRFRLATGAVAPVLFAAITLTEALTRPGYSPTRHLISELALTNRGWIQIANFILTGALLLAFATALHATARSGSPGRDAGDATRGGAATVWGPRWVGLAGAGLIAAGCF